MQSLQTLALGTAPTDIAKAAQILSDGGLVAFPTETVYGLGGDARNDLAVARIFDAKGRPRFNPLIIHLPSLDAARKFAEFNDTAERLAATFWPGPLTLVLPLKQGHGLSPLVTADLSTVAIRVPAHRVAQAVLTAFGGPVAAPSANPSGKISPTSAAHVAAGLTGRIDAIVHGGDCAVGLESTIIGLDGAPTLLRAGGVPAEAIEACLGHILQRGGDGPKPNAPGQLASHYAPGAKVRLNASGKEKGEVLLGFGPCDGADLNLSPAGDLVEAAANLFGYLHRLDALNADTIAVSPIPETGLGRAINDRLRRAAAPRPCP